MSTDHLHAPETRARAAATRAANARNTPNLVRPGSETTDLTVGTPVRISRSGVLRQYAGRSGWVAVVNTERYENGCPAYTEIGVTFAIARDWARASAAAWFRVDEVEVHAA